MIQAKERHSKQLCCLYLDEQTALPGRPGSSGRGMSGQPHGSPRAPHPHTGAGWSTPVGAQCSLPQENPCHQMLCKWRPT